MADQTKLEEMLERLINGDKAGAEELFHEYTIEKSREIYETLLEDDEDLDEADKNPDPDADEGEVGDATGGKRTGVKGAKHAAQDPKEGGKSKAVKEDDDEEVDESDDDDLEEDFDLDEFEVEADPMDAMMGGDETDDMMGDIEMGGDEEDEGEGDMEDRVEDLEDALDELKAEFEKMMAGEEGDEEGEDDMDMDMDDEEADDEDEDEMEAYAFEAKEKADKQKHPGDKKVADPEAKKGPKSAGEQMREYVEKVTASMGDNGANTKSVVAGKNDMGGTAGNLNQADTEAGVEANKGQLKGNGVFKGTPKEDNAGNVNVPGGKASKSLKPASKPKMGDTGTNGTRSTIGQ